jgi:hypothetical protein
MFKLKIVRVRIRHHHALIPLLAVVLAGSFMTIGMGLRMAVRASDVNWSKNKAEDYAVNHYTDKEYKFLNPMNRPEYSRPSPRPDYKN